MQAAPKQGAGYRENQQTAGQRIGEQYPRIRHTTSLVKIGQRCPGVGFFLLDACFHVALPVLRIKTEIGRGKRDAPIFGLAYLAPAPGDRTAGFFHDTRFGMRHFKFHTQPGFQRLRRLQATDGRHECQVSFVLRGKWDFHLAAMIQQNTGCAEYQAEYRSP
jgi:hypothetical protein